MMSSYGREAPNDQINVFLNVPLNACGFLRVGPCFYALLSFLSNFAIILTSKSDY